MKSEIDKKFGSIYTECLLIVSPPCHFSFSAKLLKNKKKCLKSVIQISRKHNSRNRFVDKVKTFSGAVYKSPTLN